MFHLVRYRYLFLLISLIIIVPGVLSMVFKGLNVGIDFVGGANIELHPQTNVTSSQITNLLKPLNLSSLQVTIGNPTNGNQSVGKTIWVRLNRQVDSNVTNSIIDTMQKKYSGINNRIYTLNLQPTITMIVFNGFAKAPQVSDIQALLKTLPNTSDPSKGPPSTVTATTPTPTTGATPTAGVTPTAGTTPTAGATPTTGVTPTATAGTTPTASASPTATAKATATAAATPAPTATAPPTNPAIYPVYVTDIAQDKSAQSINILTSSNVRGEQPTQMIATIMKGKGPYTHLITNSEVSGSVASETTTNSFLAVLAASFFILLYIWFSFRKVNKPWRYGACAIIALLHDVLVVVGVFSILGWTLHIQIDALFITALLTVVGFSVHDTIVVFDRIRENSQRRTSESFEQVVDASLIQTLARSLNTSLTVLFTLSALTLFSNAGSVRNFTLALLIGIFSGTYSSIFNASMLLVMWEKGEWIFKYFNRDVPPPVSSKGSTKERELSSTRG